MHNTSFKKVTQKDGRMEKLNLNSVFMLLKQLTVHIFFIGTLPAEADYLLAYSTSAEYVSWRNNQLGSYFITTLVKVFYEMADKEHLMDMLVEVNRRVAEEFESRYEKCKQIPEPVCRLRKKLYFQPRKVTNYVLLSV